MYVRDSRVEEISSTLGRRNDNIISLQQWHLSFHLWLMAGISITKTSPPNTPQTHISYFIFHISYALLAEMVLTQSYQRQFESKPFVVDILSLRCVEL